MEKEVSDTPSDRSQEASTVREKSSDDDTNFAPIRTGHGSRRGSKSGSGGGGGGRRSGEYGGELLGRELSHNGYGMSELDADLDLEVAAEEEETADAFQVGWEGGDSDPENPRSWPLWRKWVIVGLTCMGAFCGTNASAIYTSSYGRMNAEFGSSRLVATVGLSTFVLGIALGLFTSPLAEFYGRRPVYLTAFAGFVVFLVPCAVAQNVETIIVTRFFQGLATSAFLSVAGGTAGDLFVRQDMQAPMALVTLAPFAGPSSGPLIGGFINSYAPSWRWTHYVLLIWAGCEWIALLLFVPETYHPILLARKAAARRAATGDPRYQAPIEAVHRSVLRTVAVALVRPFQLILWEPMALVLDLYAAILLGIVYLFFGAFPLVFMNNHGFTLWQVGLTFLGLLVANIFAISSTPIWSRLRDHLAARRGRAYAAVHGGSPDPRSEPEDQLPSVIVGAPFITGGLFWFGFTTYASCHWILPIIGSAFFAFGLLLAFTGIFTFLVDAYPLYAASALAGNAFVRCTFAAAFPLFGVQMYEGLGYQWATAVLAFLTLALLPFPYLFFVYGKRLRAHSRYAKA